MSGPSLRGRLLAGAVFWSVGLFLLASVALSNLVDHHSGAAAGIHAALDYAYILPTVAVSCLVAGFLQVRRGLSGVGALRDRLAGVRGGRRQRLDGTYPSEVQPLVDDLNGLLDERDQAVQRAVTKAADLAHGLKTPLAVLAHEADRAERAGQRDVAQSIHHQVDRMRKQVDYQLAHARASAPGRSASGRVVIAESVEGLVRVLERLHVERGLVFERRLLDPAAVARGQSFDVDEMLGNLLDNACRWARSRVVVAATAEGPNVLVTIEDDGPGLAKVMREAVLRRGVRADESGPGSGLGLAIVRDLADLYGGSVMLGDAAAGGLRVELRLPA
jgi:signal transduction histidine kinase